VACALVTAFGCSDAYYDAPQVPSRALLANEPGLRVTFEDNLGFPYRLQALAVVLDGKPLYAQRFDPERSDRPAELVDLSGIAEGEHTLQLRAVASYAATRIDADEGCDVDVRVARTFHVDKRPAEVHMNLYAKANVTMPFAQRVKARVAVQGAKDIDESTRSTVTTASEVCDDAAPLAPLDERPLLEERFSYPFGMEPRLFSD